MSAAGAALVFLWLYTTEVLAGYWRGPRAGQVPWQHFGDQSLYMKSALAFAGLDFDPSRHHYPPLYPLVAALFVRLFPVDPFVFTNVVSVAGSTALLAAVFGRVIGRRPAALCALAFLVLPGIMWETFVVPWTSTLATLLVFLALWRLARLETARAVSPAESLLFSAILGLIVPTRPLDAAVALLLYPFWLAGLWRAGHGRTAARVGRMVPHLVALTAGGLPGPMILFGTDLLIYGRLSSPYLRGFGQREIFSWSTIPEKFVSIYLDSASLYVEPGQVVFRRFPWMLVGFLAIVVCLALGSLWLRAAALAAIVQLTIYVAFDDLLPNGLYRYFNYHYFRWAFWLAFMMLPASVVLVHRRFASRAWIIGAAATAAAFTLACLQLRTSESSVPAATAGDRIRVALPTGRVDYLDLAGLTADWATAYFPGQDIWVDGQRPPFVHARFLQTATGTRLLFIRPIRDATVELTAAQWRGAAESARAGTHRLTLGFPRWLDERPAPLPLDTPWRLDGMIAGLIFESGFTDFDGRGRTIVGCQAVLALPLPLTGPRYQLHLLFRAAEPVAVTVAIDGRASQGNRIEIGRGETDAVIAVPPAAASPHAMTRVRLRREGCVAGRTPGTLAIVGAKLAT